MIEQFSVHHLRFHLEPKAPLHMPAYNKGNVIRGGFASTFRLSACDAQAGRLMCAVEIYKAVFVGDGSHSATGDLQSACL